MSRQEAASNNEYVGFSTLLKRSELERVLMPYRATDQYAAIFRYYQGCVDAQDDLSLRQPLALLGEALGSLDGQARRRRETDDEAPRNNTSHVSELHEKVREYGARVSHGAGLVTGGMSNIPKKLHFVWLGGGVGDIQRDYINVWEQVLAPEGNQLNLWYDSNALLAYETHRVIVQAAKADAMAAGAVNSKTNNELGDAYVERLRPLKEQLYTHILQAQARGASADEARIDLLVRGYGQDETRLRDLRKKNLASIEVLGRNGMQLRDLALNGGAFRVQDIYQREINLRGNFAGASDVIRAEVVYLEGGMYSDVDNLPPLAQTLGGVDIGKFGENARLGVLQLLLDHNPQWMPGRQALSDRYTRRINIIAKEHLPALQRFAESHPALTDVFHVPANRIVRPDGLKALKVDTTVNNSFFMAPAGSGMLNAVIQRFLLNYEVITDTEHRALQRKISFSDMQKMGELAREVVEETFGSLAQMPDIEAIGIERLALGAADYYSDGIFPGSDSTIYITGPEAMLGGIADYEKSNLTPRTAEALRKEIAIEGNVTVNRQTEEELDHSWKEQTAASGWLGSEKKSWQDGKFAARYTGDIAQLLKGQTIEFDGGWPLIEGRHVLSASVLQRLLDHLGEPFLSAMSQGRDTRVTFDKPLPLSFDDRQAIIAQDVRAAAPAAGRDPATRNLSIVEVLERIATDSLFVQRISAAQRLLLGQLLGLESLDGRSFEAVAGELGILARRVSEQSVAGRYAVIEEQLFKYKAAEFVSGLESSVEGPMILAETALSLKRNAMANPLSLRQWGKEVARIQQVAKIEFRQRLVERSTELLGGFTEGEARLVPQDLLFDGFGDSVGRRCYPLVLAMAAAIAEDKAAVSTLRERFFMSVAEPEDSSSRSFVHTIEALQGVQENDVGASLARSSLQQVVDLLASRTTTSTLMLNSDNHAMLVAKTWVGNRSTYHFYDPNLGIIDFAQPEGMLSDMRHFFEQQGMADYYGAFGDPGLPTFDLIELHSDRVAQLELSSGVRMADVLLPGALKKADVESGRKRLASARGRALMENSRLGKSLMEMDSHWWGEQIDQASAQLLTENKLTSDFIPLFETLEISPGGQYQLTLIRPEKPGIAEQLVRVTTDDQRFLRIKNHLTELFAKLSTRRVTPLDPASVGAVHTLNAGFAIQALMNALRGREGEARSLSLAVRLHAYVNYAQLIHGLVSDVAGVVGLVRQGLAQERLIAQTSSTVAGEALGHVAGEGVGTVLGLINVGFDIYQLTQADNDVDVARLGTQLGFDSASAVLGIAGMGAGLASAATVATFLGAASVVAAGLAVGVAALVQGFAMVAERAKQVGLFFYELDQAYRGVPFSWDMQQNVWQPHPKLIIRSLNLREGVVQYDSQRLFPLRDHFGVPDFDVDYDRAINLRQSLGLPGSGRFNPAADQVIILPCTPQTFYGYNYIALPFSTLRHDKGFDVIRRLEKKKPDGTWQFLFSFYSFPAHQIVQGIYPAYRPHAMSTIQITLDDLPRTLVVPTLLKSWYGKIAYEIEAGDAACTLMLSPGVDVELKALGLKSMQWALLATWAEESDVRFVRGEGLKIGTVNITYSGRAGAVTTLHLAGNNRYRVDHHGQVLLPLEVDAVSGADIQTLDAHFKALAREHRLEQPYTPVHNFLIPFEDPTEPRRVVAYYDSAQQRFLYIQNDEVMLPDDCTLGAVIDDAAWFYHPQGVEVFKVDVVSGLISQRYRLMLKTGESTITQCVAVPGGGVRIVQEVRRDAQYHSLEYVLTDEGAFLHSLSRGLDTSLENILGATPTVGDWKLLLGDYVAWPPTSSPERFETSVWQPAPFVSIYWCPEPGFTDMSWVRSSDGLIIRPPPQLHHARGWKDADRDNNQLNLLVPSGNEGDVFVVYKRGSSRVCVQRRSVVGEQVKLSIEWKRLEGLKSIVAMPQGTLALTDSGLFYGVTPEGDLQLAGVTQVWFKDRAQWWTQLPSVAAQAPSLALALIGLSTADGDAQLCAWYLEGRLLLADLGYGKEVRLLGMTPDNAAAWLFDVSTGEIHSQAFMADTQLPAAFDEGIRLLSRDVLPAPQSLWKPWTFAAVKRRGAGLLATTVEGIQMELNHQESALITGVDSQWVREHADNLGEHLSALVSGKQRCAPLLKVAHVWRQQWFVSSSGRLIEAAKVSGPDSSMAVGTRQRTNVLLFDTADGVLRSYPRTDTVAPLAYVQRDAKLLCLENNRQLDDLLPLIPDDVNTLILRLGQGGACRLSQAAWRRLESVIVDCRPPLGGVKPEPVKLDWALDSPRQLIVSLEGEHLVMLDPDTCHSLIVRHANAADVTLRGEALLSIRSYKPFVTSRLVAALAARPNATDGVLLNEFWTTRAVETTAANG